MITIPAVNVNTPNFFEGEFDLTDSNGVTTTYATAVLDEVSFKATAEYANTMVSKGNFTDAEFDGFLNQVFPSASAAAIYNEAITTGTKDRIAGAIVEAFFSLESSAIAKDKVRLGYAKATVDLY